MNDKNNDRKNKEAIPIALCRVTLGAIFLIFGLNGFIPFLPEPSLGERAQTFMAGLAQAPYFWPLEKGAEVVAGAMLLSGMWIPLALAILTPIVANILLFHAFLAPGGIALALLLTLLQISLVGAYWEHFRPLLSGRWMRIKSRIEPVGGRITRLENKRHASAH